MLQNRIEQLEQLLEENHEIISHIKDSVLELTANAEGQPVVLPFHMPNGSWVLPPESKPSFYSVSSQDCQFALGGKGQKTDIQVKLTSAEQIMSLAKARWAGSQQDFAVCLLEQDGAAHGWWRCEGASSLLRQRKHLVLWACKTKLAA